MLTEDIKELISINKDRIEGFKKIEKQAKDLPEVLMLCGGKVVQSELFIEELTGLVKKTGDIVKGSVEGRLLRAWMDFKNALTRDNTAAILDSAVFGEDSAVKVYEEVLMRIKETDEHKGIIHQQQEKIQQSLDEFRRLKEQLHDSSMHNH